MGIRFNARTSAIETDATSIDFTQPITTPASTTSLAGLNIAEGVAPSAPVDGDVWVTAGGNFNARLNGVTVDLAAGGATNLTWTASTRVLASSTGTDATITLFTSSDAGLTPSSGGGTTNFLRADGTWAAPAGGGNSFETQTVTDTDSGFTWAETGSAVAESSTDTLTWVSGTDIDIDVDATSDAIRIAFSNATGYTTNTGTVTSVAAGDGLDFTSITGSGSVTMGTPGSLSSSSTNAVTATSHTHAITSIDAADVAAGNLGSGVIPYTTVDTTNSAFKVPFINTTAGVSGNFAYYFDNNGFTYNPSTGLFTTGSISSATITATTNFVDAGLTDNDVLVAGTGGVIEDSAGNLTFDGNSFAAYGAAPATHRLGIDASNNLNFEVGTNYAIIQLDDDNVSTEGQFMYFDLVSSSTGSREYQFLENGGLHATFDITNNTYTFNGSLELIAKTDHGPSWFSGGAMIWPKSRSFGEELLYTTGDNTGIDHPLQNANVHVWYFDATTTAADPGAGDIRFNSGTPASVTNLYINDTESTGKDGSYLLSNLADGDIMKLKDVNDAARYLVVSVNGTPTDNTGWWTVPVTVIHAGTLPLGTNPIHIDVEWAGSQAPGNVSSTGTPVNNQLAIWTDATTIEGDPDITYNGTSLTVAAILAMQGDITLRDNDEINFGNAAGDPSLYFNGTNLILDGMTTGVNWSFIDGGVTRATWDLPTSLTINDGAAFRANNPADNAYATLYQDATSGHLESTSGGIKLGTYNLESTTGTLSTNAETFVYGTSNVHIIDIEAATGNVTFTLSGGPPSGQYGQMTIHVTQDGTAARTITWAGGTFRWVGGTAHPLTSTLNGFTIYTFETWDGGTTWYGAGADYS